MHRHALNTAAKVMLEQADANLRRDLPMFIEQGEHKAHAVIVGGGPSLRETLPALRFAAERGHIVFALNGTHDWLIDHGLVPNALVLLDARPENVRFVQRPQKGITYLVAAQCHPTVFDALAGHDVLMWVAGMQGMAELAERHEKPIILVGGGGTVGLKTMALAHLWGFRSLSLFGFDSCYRAGAHHAYAQDLNDGERVIDLIRCGRRFHCSPWMLRQADDFVHDAQILEAEGCAIKAYGAGLIQALLTDLHMKEQRHAG